MTIRQSSLWSGLLAVTLLSATAVAQDSSRRELPREESVISQADVKELLGADSKKARRIADALQEYDRSLKDLIDTAEGEVDGRALAARLKFMKEAPGRTNERNADGERLERLGKDGGQLIAMVACIDDRDMIHVVAVDVASGDVIDSRETSPGASADRGEPSAEQQPRIVKATEFIGSDVENADGEDLGDIKDLALDGSTGEIRYAVLSFGGWLGIGDKLFAVPYEAFQHTEDRLQLNVPKEKMKTATGFDKDHWPNMADPKWAEEVNRFYGIGRATRPDTAGTEVRIVRASTMMGADVHNRNDEDLGEIEDLALDPQEGKVRYAVLAHGGVAGLGEKLFAIPWNAVSGSDDKIIVDITREKLENAPGFDDEHWPDMASRRWGEDVHRYYGQRPYWDEE